MAADLRQLLLRISEVLRTSPQSVESEILAREAISRVAGIKISRADLLLRAGQSIPADAVTLALEWARRCAAGEPLQYVLGTQQFLDHDYEVGPEVLIPRPETECLVLEASRVLAEEAKGPEVGLEVGVGSGIISIEMLSRFVTLKMVSTEISDEAALRAESNARSILGNSCSRLKVLRVPCPSTVLEPFAGIVADFLISNPPYLDETEASEVEPGVRRFEPRQALFAPPGDALYFYREIAHGARRVLREGGFVFLEMPHERAEAIFSLFRESGYDVSVVEDLTQRPRVLIART